ncbi:MAG: glutamate--tRNA ligase family protein [Candidatus Pseudobacter hemicellulosilyticus]|uniref:Glutamate--tRNA ligase family protein n=1 Tax=Candidatus Pseudobacter hemicellulosilyticus TaxID=3121375 RepID=A0AAJ6BHJ2_9BACT|nr:MAG: glutamate--tRNA ligase family protein [Pseudobacter sp.]
MTQDHSIYKTRIAPTPSGYLHLGNILSFAITTGIAQQANARILLRIDDLDQERARKEYLQDIFDTLHFLGIPWQEGPDSVENFEIDWSQVHRLPLYQQALEQLATQGLVFACTCSRSSLQDQLPGQACPCIDKVIPLDTPHASWRINSSNSIQTPLTVHTLNGTTLSATLPADMHYFVVRKKDSYPAYQLSSLVDDLHFGITHIVRGQDLWASTLAQLFLAELLQLDKFTQIRFHHHALITDAGGNKLSKSAGATSIHYLRQQGVTVTDIYGQLASLLDQPGAANDWTTLAAIVNK